MRASPWGHPCCVSVFFRLLSKIHFFMVLFSHFGEDGGRQGFIIAIQQIIANIRRNGTSLHSPAE